MIKEALELVATMAIDSQKPITVMDGPRDLRVAMNGELQEPIPKPIAPRDHTVHSLTDLIEYANAAASESPHCVLWFEHGRVVLITDNDDHRIERVTLTLEVTHPFETMKALEVESQWLEQKRMLRIARIDLAGVFAPGQFLEHVRNVIWKSAETAASNRQHGQSTMGSQLEHAVGTPAGKFPEEIEGSLSVYKTDGLAEPRTVRCFVEVDEENRRFRLTPRPDELDRLVQLAMDDLRNKLTTGLTTGIPIYHGRP